MWGHIASAQKAFEEEQLFRAEYEKEQQKTQEEKGAKWRATSPEAQREWQEITKQEAIVRQSESTNNGLFPMYNTEGQREIESQKAAWYEKMNKAENEEALKKRYPRRPGESNENWKRRLDNSYSYFENEKKEKEKREKFEQWKAKRAAEKKAVEDKRNAEEEARRQKAQEETRKWFEDQRKKLADRKAGREAREQHRIRREKEAQADAKLPDSEEKANRELARLKEEMDDAEAEAKATSEEAEEAETVQRSQENNARNAQTDLKRMQH